MLQEIWLLVWMSLLVAGILPPLKQADSDVFVVTSTFSTFIPMPASLLSLVTHQAKTSSNQSWELGTLAEAYLELDWPQTSIYGPQGVPPPRFAGAESANNMTIVLSIANDVIATRPAGSLALLAESSVGDPPSVGIAVLIANWTKASRPSEARNDYNTPLVQQLDYLLDLAPRTADGAISHRSEQVQLWSDFIYMTPPFLAYYGALAQPVVNSSLLFQAYHQISLYRKYLYDADPGLWRHVALGDWQDVGYWSTGNGWAAAGMLRVLVTLNQTTVGAHGQFVAAQRDLQNWATEIVNNIWTYQLPSGCLRNYATNTTSFEDAASTALLASVTYRLAALPSLLRGPPASATSDPTAKAGSSGTLQPLIPLEASSVYAAHMARACVWNNLDNATGWLDNVVDPYAFGNKGSQSPEGQSFVLLMESAWRGWLDYVIEKG